MIAARTVLAVLALHALAPLGRAVPALTAISDVIYRTDGSRYTGTLTITNPAFVASDGTQVPQGSVTTRVINGVLSLSLIPTDGAAQLVQPTSSGLFFTIRYTPNPSPGGQQIQYWSVPTSMTPVGLASLIVNPPPVNTFLIGLSQLSQGGAVTNNCLTWNGPVTQGWGPGLCAAGFPFTITAVSSITVTHGFNSLNVDVEIYDGSGNLVEPKGWQILNANQVLVTFDASFTGRGVVK